MKAWRHTRQAAYKKRKPWVRFVEWARRRVLCRDVHKYFPFYGAKGIKCHLTGPQLEEIWARDNAAALKRPSLDRKDPAFDYANWNVRFIEFNLNSRLAWDKSLTLDGTSTTAEFC